MAEERIRYRVELDPRQVESELSSLRSSIGGAVSSIGSGIQYGGQLTSGAYNSISADLSSAQQIFINRPTSSQIRRDLTEAGLEATAAAATMTAGGAPLVAGAAATFGVASTASALAGGVGYTLAAGKTVLGAGATVAGLGAKAAGMMVSSAAGALATPVGATLATAAVLGAATVSVGDRVLSDYRGANAVEDILVSRGYNQDTASYIAPNLIARGHSELNMSAAETTGILQQGMASGLFNSIAGDPDAIGKKLIDVAKKAKSMMKVLNSSLGEAMQHMSEMRQMGIHGDAVGTQLDIFATGAATGLGANVMTRAAGLGAQMARQVGLATGTGAGLAISSLAQAQAGIRNANLTSGQLSSIGGVSGLGTTMAQARASMVTSPLGRAAAFGTDNLFDFATGQTSATEAVARSAGRLASGGAAGLAEGLFEMDREVSELTPEQTQLMQLGVIKNVSSVFGIDPQNRKQLAMVAGGALGFNVGTPQGRAQALAAVEGIMDPNVANRRSAEMESRRNRMMEQASGFMPTLGRAAGALYESTLGAAANNISYDLNEGLGWLENADARIRRSIGRKTRSAIRSVPGGESIVGGVNAERYSVRPSSEITRSADTAQKLIEALARSGDRNVTDIVEKWNSKIAGGYDTEQNLEERAKIMSLFETSRKTIEDNPEETDSVLLAINVDEEFMSSLEGASPAEAIYKVQERMGDAAPSTRIIAAALKESGVDLGEFTPRTGGMEVSERADRQSIDSLNALMYADDPGFPASYLLGGPLAKKLFARDLSTTERQVRSVLRAAGSGERTRQDAAIAAFKTLAFTGEDRLEARRNLMAMMPGSGAKVARQLDVIYRHEDKRKTAIETLRAIAEPKVASDAMAAGVENSQALTADRIATLLGSLDDVEVAQGGPGMDSVRFAGQDPGLMDTYREMSGFIKNQTDINRAIFENWGSRLSPSDLRNATQPQGD